MPISLRQLRSAPVLKSAPPPKAHSFAEAQRKGVRTAFLCHSHSDSDLVKGLLVYFRDSGWNVYVDWADSAMPEQPTRETAERIRAKIRELDLFLFLATPNSVASRWCPWEIGYADGVKVPQSIVVIPTEDDAGRWYGNEYLQLYRRVLPATEGGLGIFEPGASTGILLRSL